jgi:hypothetical protein
MKSFILARDANHYTALGFNAPDYNDARVLAANVVESHTVPAGAKKVSFSATGNFYARFYGTAAVPAADVTDGTGSELNPGLRTLENVTAISLISPVACTVTMAFYI